MVSVLKPRAWLPRGPGQECWWLCGSAVWITKGAPPPGEQPGLHCHLLPRPTSLVQWAVCSSACGSPGWEHGAGGTHVVSIHAESVRNNPGFWTAAIGKFYATLPAYHLTQKSTCLRSERGRGFNACLLSLLNLLRPSLPEERPLTYLFFQVRRKMVSTLWKYIALPWLVLAVLSNNLSTHSKSSLETLYTCLLNGTRTLLD